MPSETEVISCPACRHLVRVPADWLGTSVQCPECKAAFKAPVRDGDRLTDAELISAPTTAAPLPQKRGKLDPMLLLPAFGLMLVGFASTAVNGWTTVRYARDPAAAEQDVGQIVKTWHGQDKDAKADDGAKKAEQDAAGLAPKIRVLIPVFAVVGAFVFYGGLAMAFRKHYRMAQLGCVLAAINLANGCCVPGALFGVWGLLMLRSDEGRNHFA